MDIPLSMNMESSEFNLEKSVKDFAFINRVRDSVIDLWNEGLNPIILIVGKSRRGKSTTASIITEQLKTILGDKINFEPDKHIKSEVQGFLEAIMQNQNSILINEESENELYSANWNTLESQLFHKVLVSQGKQHNIYILILHRFNDLNKNNRLKVDWLITMAKKGFGYCQKIENKANDIKDEIKLSAVRRYPIIKYDKEMINKELWEKWENVVNPIKDKMAQESIDRLQKKHDKFIKDTLSDVVYPMILSV